MLIRSNNGLKVFQEKEVSDGFVKAGHYYFLSFQVQLMDLISQSS